MGLRRSLARNSGCQNGPALPLPPAARSTIISRTFRARRGGPGRDKDGEHVAGVDILEVRGTLQHTYQDVFTSEAMAALETVGLLDAERKAVMRGRIERRAGGARERQRLAFLDPGSYIPRTRIKVADARNGDFVGSEIPPDLRRQWIQGTGPAAK